jgi:hypothetical protein
VFEAIYPSPVFRGNLEQTVYRSWVVHDLVGITIRGPNREESASMPVDQINSFSNTPNSNCVRDIYFFGRNPAQYKSSNAANLLGSLFTDDISGCSNEMFSSWPVSAL